MKTLIVYATKFGAVEKAAELINSKLIDKAEVIDLKKNKAPKAEDYDFILIGGSIHMGKIQKSISSYIDKNKDVLMKKRIGLFISCGYHENIEDYLHTVLGDKLYKHAEIKADVGYAYYLEKMNAIFRKMIKGIAKIESTVENYNEAEIDKIITLLNK